MRIHRNAKLTPGGRAAMIERLNEGWSVAMGAAAFHQSETTVRKWSSNSSKWATCDDQREK